MVGSGNDEGRVRSGRNSRVSQLMLWVRAGARRGAGDLSIGGRREDGPGMRGGLRGAGSSRSCPRWLAPTSA